MPLAAVCGEARDSMTRTRLPQHRRCGAVDSLQFLCRRLQHWPVVHIVEVSSLRDGSGVSLQWHDERGACSGAEGATGGCGEGERKRGGWWLVVGGWWLVVGGVGWGLLTTSSLASPGPKASSTSSGLQAICGRGSGAQERAGCRAVWQHERRGVLKLRSHRRQRVRRL